MVCNRVPNASLRSLLGHLTRLAMKPANHVKRPRSAHQRPLEAFLDGQRGSRHPHHCPTRFWFSGTDSTPPHSLEGNVQGCNGHRLRCCSGDKSKGTAAFRNRQPLRKTKFFEGYQLLILLLIWLLILGFGGIPQQVGSSVATSTRRVVLSWILDKSNIQLHFLFPKYLIYVFYMILI